MEPAQLRTREREAEAITQQPVHRTDAERPNEHPLQPALWNGAIESKSRLGVTDPKPAEDRDRLIPQTSKHELEHERGGLVQPLNVVDRDRQGSFG